MFRIVFLKSLNLAFFLTIGCDSSVNVRRSKPESSLLTIVDRSKTTIAKPGQKIELQGEGFRESETYFVIFPNSVDSSLAATPIEVEVLSPTEAAFSMPSGLGLGEKSYEIYQRKDKLKTLSIFADQNSNKLPLSTMPPEEVCSTLSYINAQGNESKGTKDCAAGSVDDCTSDGQTGCRTTSQFLAASAAATVAGNIKAGVTIAGTAGTFSGSFSNCSSDGEVGCVTTAGFKAADMTYAVAGNILSGSTIAGTSGSVSLPTVANVFAGVTYGPAGASTGILTLPSAANVRSSAGAFGVGGTSVTPSLADCSANNVQGCVTTSTYRSADLTNLAASNIVNGVSIAGTTGNVTLPTAANVYLGVTFGAASATTGTLTLPSAAQVRSSAGAFGVGGNSITPSLADCSSNNAQGCVTTASYRSADLTNLAAGNIVNGVSIAGTTGNVTLPTAANVYTGITFGASGATTGTLTLPTAAQVRSSAGAFGVGGSSITPTLADCSANNVQGCVTTSSYRSADLANLAAGNIKSGVAIAGTTGDYPSATYPLSGADSTADLDSATFNAKIKSSAAFEYWTSSGSRETGNGDADITATNIKDTISIFGETGSFTGSGGGTPDEWDLRAGVTVGSVTGKLKVDCRSAATLVTFDAGVPYAATVDSSTDYFTVTSHGFADNQMIRVHALTIPTGLINNAAYYVRNSTANTFQVSLTSGGAAINITSNGTTVFAMRAINSTVDIWDSIDDYYAAPVSTPTYTGWSSNNYCGGVETVLGDAKVWRDVTTTGDGVTASTCGSTSAHCTLKNKITGQDWAATDYTQRHWAQAASYCDNLSRNGKTDWRLPTKKEWLGAHQHGIVSTVSVTNWMDGDFFRDNNVWTATTSTVATTYAWYIKPANGALLTAGKETSYFVVCVRP